MTGVLVAAGLVVLAVAISHRRGLGLERELAIAAVRATLQLAAVGALVTLVFEHVGLAAGFVAVMLTAAALTSGHRLRGIRRPVMIAGAAIVLGAGTGLAPLLITGAFELAPRELIPVAGILIGGAMAATSLTGRRLLEDVGESMPAIEARLALGVPARTALQDCDRRAVVTGLIPILDQTKNVGLVTLPGTFVGLVLGGASPVEAARVQLIVLLTVMGVQVVAAVVCAALVTRACVLPGERVEPPA